VTTVLLQADEKALKRRLDEAKELEDKQAEIYNHVTGDLLTENPEVANSSFGPGRKIQYLYKGMSPEERENVRKEQLRQIVENEVRKYPSDKVLRSQQSLSLVYCKYSYLYQMYRSQFFSSAVDNCYQRFTIKYYIAESCCTSLAIERFH
jgi:hypothetical protein